MTDLALAVDIGGTKMAAGLVDAQGHLSFRSQVPTRRTTGPADAELLWGDLAELVEKVLAQVGSGHRVVVGGVGCGGPMHLARGEVSPLNIAGWRDFPLRGRLALLTGLPTCLDNDAKALALAEGWIGAAARYDNYIGMVVSTGVGGGIVLDGRLLHGRTGNGGHIGHMVVVPDGRPCVCGSRGCLEAEASGTAIAAISGQPAALAPVELRRRTGTLVGRAIGATVNLLDLSLAVVSGSVALGFGDAFFDAAQREVDATCGLDFTRGAQVVRGGLGESGPLVGAGRLGWLSVPEGP
jgi:glucokinase